MFSKSMIHGKPKGFTLLELLICMTILAMILSILTVVFRLGFQAWKYSDHNLPERDFLRSFSLVMVSQIRSVYPTQKSLFNFHGNASEMSFVTTLSIFRGKSAGNFFYVSYRLIEDWKETGRYQLMVYERIFNSASFRPKAISLDEYVPLLKGIKEYHLAYLTPAVAGRQARLEEEWNERVPSRLPPEAVKINFLFGEPITSLELIIPIYCSGILGRMVGGR